MIEKAEFEQELVKKRLGVIVQKYLFDDFPFCFRERPDLYYEMRKSICEKFDIHPQNFAIVGSAKVGFSLAPQKYGEKFSESSDIDIVLVSDKLFEDLWLSLIEFRRTTVYKLSSMLQERFSNLQKTLFYGIIRFDKLSNDFTLAKQWWKFFNEISNDERFGPRRIRAAFFKGWKHASFYYEDGLRILRQNYESYSIKSDNSVV